MSSPGPFIDSLPDLLSSIGEIEVKRMFGGHGVFKNELMFGIVSDGRLYLRTDDETKVSYIDAGSEPFVFGERDGKVIVSKYYEPPESAFINPQKMKPWAMASWGATQRTAKPKNKTRRKKATKKSPRTAADD